MWKPNGPLVPSCRMEDALTPEQCNKISIFLKTLLMASDDYNIPVGKFIKAYRFNINGPHVRKEQVNKVIAKNKTRGYYEVTE